VLTTNSNLKLRWDDDRRGASSTDGAQRVLQYAVRAGGRRLPLHCNSKKDTISIVTLDEIKASQVGCAQGQVHTRSASLTYRGSPPLASAAHCGRRPATFSTPSLCLLASSAPVLEFNSVLKTAGCNCWCVANACQDDRTALPRRECCPSIGGACVSQALGKLSSQCHCQHIRMSWYMSHVLRHIHCYLHLNSCVPRAGQKS
jgi:hypothetical protein